MSIAQLQLFLRHDEQKTTERYAGHLNSSTKVQGDVLGDYWNKILTEVDGDGEQSEKQSSTKSDTMKKARLFLVQKDAT